MSDSQWSEGLCIGYNNNPFTIPEPYFLPGYTGHCPKYTEIIGQTYGRATHTVMETLPLPPARLRPLPTPRPTHRIEDFGLFNNRTRGRHLRTSDITPGYKGHIPRYSFQVGLNFTQGCIKAVSEFEKRQEAYQQHLKTAGQPAGV